MRALFRRAGVIAGAAAVVLGSAAGIAAAGSSPTLAWSAPGGSPITFDYGSVNAGTTVTPATTFTLTNYGGSASAVATVTVTGMAFKLHDDHCTGTSLGPHKSCTVQATYSASTPGGGTDAGALTAAGLKAKATASLKLQGESTNPASISIIPTDASAVPTSLVPVSDDVTGAGFTPGATLTAKATGAGLGKSSIFSFPDTANASGAFDYDNDTGSFALALYCGADVTVTVTDGVHSASANVTTVPCADIVTVDNPGDQTSDVGDTVSGNLAVPITAFDSGGAPLTITWSGTPGKPPGLSLIATDSEDAQITGSPTAAGTYTVTVTATNATTGMSASAQFTWTVNAAPPADLTLSPGQLLSINEGDNDSFLDLGSVAAGSSVTQTFAIANTGTGSSDPLDLIAGGASFGNDNCSGVSLAPAKSCTFELTFTQPTACPSGSSHDFLLHVTGTQPSTVAYADEGVQLDCP